MVTASGHFPVIQPHRVVVMVPAEVLFLIMPLVKWVLPEATFESDDDECQTSWLLHVDYRDIEHRVCMLRVLAA